MESTCECLIAAGNQYVERTDGRICFNKGIICDDTDSRHRKQADRRTVTDLAYANWKLCKQKRTDGLDSVFSAPTATKFQPFRCKKYE